MLLQHLMMIESTGTLMRKSMISGLCFRAVRLSLILGLAVAVNAAAQICYTANEMEPPVRSAIERSAQQIFDMAAKGDVFGLKQNAGPAVANDFSGIERAVVANQEGLSGGQPTLRASYLLDATGGEQTVQQAEFYCGVFGARGQTSNSAGFRIPNLPAGRYAVTIQDVVGKKGPYTLSLVLQEAGGAWKLAGFYAKSGSIAGHDAQWFLTKAREYKAKGQNLNAYFYFIQGRDLLAPVPFMSTLELDKVFDEAQTAQTSDIPTNKPVPLTSGSATYNVIQMFPVVVGDQLALVLKYQWPDISDTGATFQQNMNVMRAALTKWPELREGFQTIVARAVAPAGNDYGSMMAMKDVK